MKVRSELNALLYTKKMENRKVPGHLPHDSKLTSIAGGDMKAVRSELNSGGLTLISDERMLSKNALKNAIYHFVLSASAISDACNESGMGQTEAYTLSDLYILKADECMTIDAVCRLYEDMCLDFAERMQEIRKETVVSLHIRKCIDHIYENLGADLSVKALSEVTGLNRTYLSRLFRQEVGTSIKYFVKEARVDTAQNLLRYSDLPYSVISTSLGFSTQSVFIAVFKEITGVTPRAYREKNYMIHSCNSDDRNHRLTGKGVRI